MDTKPLIYWNTGPAEYDTTCVGCGSHVAKGDATATIHLPHKVSYLFGSCCSARTDFYTRGHAQPKPDDLVWTMEDKPGLLGVRIGSGDEGVLYLTGDQTLQLIEQASAWAFGDTTVMVTKRRWLAVMRQGLPMLSEEDMEKMWLAFYTMHSDSEEDFAIKCSIAGGVKKPMGIVK